MNACDRLAGCPFFNDKMETMPAMADIYKSRYCRDEFTSCARNRIATAYGPDRVPAGMYPNDQAAADRVLEELAG